MLKQASTCPTEPSKCESERASSGTHARPAEELRMLLQGETVASGGFAAGSFATPSVVAMVQRDGPFGSSYQVVLQVNLPCNADYQYRKRAVPDLAATEHPSEKPSADTGKNTFLACLCYVYRKLPAAGKAILVTLATAMRAANICDRVEPRIPHALL